MYNSPIEMLITDIHHQIVKQQDEDIYQAVLHYIPNVDKQELLRALMYDRNQYEKGYFDGKEEATPKWIPVAGPLLPEADKEVLCFTKRGDIWIAMWNSCGDRMWSDGEYWANETEVTHWMPLPEPPKEEA